MANLNYAHGFEPFENLSATSLSVQTIDIAPTNTAIFINDLLERRSDGYIWPAQASSTTIIGVSAQYIPANTGGKVSYYALEGLQMMAQVSNDSPGVTVQADFDLTYNIKVGSGSAVTGYSAMQIDGASGAASATLPIKILYVWPETGKQTNTLGEPYVKVVCMANLGVTKGAGIVG